MTTINEAETADRRRQRAVWALVALAGLGLVACLGTVLLQRSQISNLRGELDTANKTGSATRAAVNGLSHQMAALQGTGASTGSVADLKSQVDALASKVKDDEARLKRICDQNSLGSYQSNLDGQQTAMSDPNYQYFSNLSGLVAAVCQQDAVPGTD